jgi:predicted kinase/ribosomal protein S18 acetylase RimI-like enzyme
MARLINLCGLPGSGKTTVASRIARAAPGTVRMCTDDWMRAAAISLWDEAARATIEAGQWVLAQQLLLGGADVVIEWGTWAREERELLRTWCRANDVAVSLVHLDVPFDELRRRLAVRNTRDGEVTLQPELLEEWTAGPWQPPTPDELALYDSYELPAPGWVSRPWRTDDIAFLWDVLYLSIHVREGYDPPPRSILDDHDLAHYLRDFGRYPGDDAQIVEDHAGTRLAAAFSRHTTAHDPGWGHVSPDIPELGMAVVASHRGRGIGRLVLEGLLQRRPTMSLSVDLENSVARRLYESLGFEWVADEGTAATMLRRGAPPARE